MSGSIMGRVPKPKGAFNPPTGRKTSIVVLKRFISESREDVRIVVSLSTQSSTEVFQVEPRNGSIQFAGENVFSDEASALSSLFRQGFIEVLRGSALLGYVMSETLSGILVATGTCPKVTLPGGHIVHMVTEAQWILVSLERTAHASVLGSEQEFWRLLQQNSVSGMHYYCETADVSRPFPSEYEPFNPDQNFVWNAWLSKPVRDLGLLRHCPALLQGAVESSDEVHSSGQRYTITTISRRSRRHPGTRYLARGLNDFAGPGNEIEVELIIWKGMDNSHHHSNKYVDWCRVFWRRGTVPIWWGVEIQPLNKGLQAEVYVKDEGTYVGMLTYFKSLLKRMEEESEKGKENTEACDRKTEAYLNSEDSQDAVTCVNLLHCNPKKASELMLSSHFQEGMRHIKDRMGQKAGSSLKLVNFDWHGTMGHLSEERGVEAFWHFIEQPVKHAGLARGSMMLASDEKDKKGTQWGDHWRMHWKQRQRGILRFNCADSLDRTNAASCFAMLPVLQEGLRLLGISLDMASDPVTRLPHQESTTTSFENLPSGWEVREHEGRLLYIDHKNRKTQWEHPQADVYSVDKKSQELKDAPWSFFLLKLDDIRMRLFPDVIYNYVTMFKKHGDVHSELYTGSAAMHSHILGIVLPAELNNYGSTSSVGRLQNLKVAVQRRWNNTVSDAPRQQSIELFLGLNISRHCPGLSLTSLQDNAEDEVFRFKLDENEMAESKAIAHLGAELKALALKKHDGRLGLREDVSGNSVTVEESKEEIDSGKQNISTSNSSHADLNSVQDLLL